MQTITMDVPDETLAALSLTRDEAAKELPLAAAVKLFELGRLSSGAAAHLAGVPRVVFLNRLADFGVETFSLSPDDLAGETPLV